MTSEFYNLRRDKLIRPAPEQPREQSDGWRDDMPDFSWKGANPALPPKGKQKPNIAHVTRRPKDAPPLLCKSCHDKTKPIHKQGYCLDCYKDYRRKVEKGYRDRKRSEKQPKPERVCKECGKPAVTYSTNRLCSEHLIQYQHRIQTSEADVIKEAHDARKKALLEKLWSEKQKEYQNEE